MSITNVPTNGRKDCMQTTSNIESQMVQIEFDALSMFALVNLYCIQCGVLSKLISMAMGCDV